MKTIALRDGDATFAVDAAAPERPERAVLFSVGGGGDPGRHTPLLETLADRGFAVVAPHFERMTSPHPTEQGLLLRCRRWGKASGRSFNTLGWWFNNTFDVGWFGSTLVPAVPIAPRLVGHERRGEGLGGEAREQIEEDGGAGPVHHVVAYAKVRDHQR